MSTQPTPEALRLADLIHCGDDKCQCSFNLAAAELRGLYALTEGTPATGGEPVGWRYQDARGHYRYRGYVPRFDKDYALLKPIPLYTSPQPVREPAGWLYDWISDEGELVRDWFTTDYDEAHSEANQAHNIRSLDYRGTSPQPAAHPATVAACIARLEQGGQSAAVSILRHHFEQKGGST